MKRRCAGVFALAIAMSAVMVGCQTRAEDRGCRSVFGGRLGVGHPRSQWGYAGDGCVERRMGGVLGMRLFRASEDNQADPSVAVSVAGTLIGKDKVHYMIGEVFSMITIPLSDATNKSKVILVAPLSTNEALTVDQSGSTKPYVFRACFTDPFRPVRGLPSQ